MCPPCGVGVMQGHVLSTLWFASRGARVHGRQARWAGVLRAADSPCRGVCVGGGGAWLQGMACSACNGR